MSRHVLLLALVFSMSAAPVLALDEGGNSHKTPYPPGSKHRSSQPRPAQKDVDFGPYMKEMQTRIKRCWFPPRGQESRRNVFTWDIQKNGNINNLRLHQTSGLRTVDAAGMTAILDAAPLSPLPECAPACVNIQFTFDYNVFTATIDKETELKNKIAELNKKKNPKGLSQATADLANYYFENYNNDQALKTYKQAKVLLLNEEKNTKLESTIEIKLAKLCSREGLWSQSATYFKEGLALEPTPNDKSADRISNLNGLATALLRADDGRQDEALKVFDQVIENTKSKFSQRNYIFEASNNITIMSDSYLAKKDWQKALPLCRWRASHPIFQSGDNQRMELIRTLESLADCHFELGHHEAALALYAKVLSLSKDCPWSIIDLTETNRRYNLCCRKLGLPTKVEIDYLADVQSRVKHASDWAPFALGSTLLGLLLLYFLRGGQRSRKVSLCGILSMSCLFIVRGQENDESSYKKTPAPSHDIWLQEMPGAEPKQLTMGIPALPDLEIPLNNVTDRPNKFKLLGPASQHFICATRRCKLWINPNEYLKHSKNLAAKGLWEEAIAESEQALAADPYRIELQKNSSSIRQQYGKALLKKQDFDSAAAQFRQAIFLDPLNNEADLELSKCISASNNDPKDYHSRNAEGLQFEAEKNYPCASVEFAKCCSLRPESGVAHYNYARVLKRTNRLDECLYETRKALACSWQDNDAMCVTYLHHLLGDCLKQLAVEAEASGYNKRSRSFLANAYKEFRSAIYNQQAIHNKDLASALCLRYCALEALRINPSFNNHLALADAYMLCGDPDNAIKQYNECLRLHPERTDLSNDQNHFVDLFIARYYASSENETFNSVKRIKDLIDRDPKAARVAKLFYILGRLRERQLDCVKAQKCYQRAMSLDPKADPDLEEAAARIDSLMNPPAKQEPPSKRSF